MDCKIAFLSADLTLAHQVELLFPQEVASGQFKTVHIEISEIRTSQVERLANDLGLQIQREGYDAAVTRGGVFSGLPAHLHIPVFQLEVNTVDILLSIRTARQLGKQIILLLWQGVYFKEELWTDLLTPSIVVERFSDITSIPPILQKYQHCPQDYVVISGGIGGVLARELGMDHVMLNCSRESIYEMVNHVCGALNQYRRERYENELLQTILTASHDATVAIDHRGNLVLFNRLAEQMFGLSAGDVLGQPVEQVLPNLSFMRDHLREGRGDRTDVRQIGGTTVAANLSRLLVDGNTLGVVCLFQDITRLQKLEKKIRFELNKKGLIARHTLDDIVTQSANMEQVVRRARIVAASDQTAIIFGESGTGKELLAQGIHNASPRRTFPFVAINCGALSETLLESELFGYDEGAFTGARKGGKPGLFELAHGGTIFLDEINSISMNMQTKLLRVLEEREIMHIGSDYVIPLDVRVIAAANQDLYAMVVQGTFRRDLFYRLSILELTLPPLRKRPQDIPLLFQTYLERHCRPNPPPPIPDSVAQQLMSYTWPGNVRELRSAVQRFLLFGTVELDHTELPAGDLSQAHGLLNLREIDHYVEEKIIHMLLAGGLTKMQVADLLGISRSALWKKLNA